MLAGFSTLVVASDNQTPTDVTEKLTQGYMEVVSAKFADMLKSSQQAGSYVANQASELCEVVALKSSEFGTSVANKATEFGSTVVSKSSELGSAVALKSSEMTDASVKFVKENEQAVIVSSVVVASLAAVAALRYYAYGYVFYKSTPKQS